jgi:hypothetical protein
VRSGLDEKSIDVSVWFPITESSFAEDASEEVVELEADCECPALCTLRRFCPAFGAEIVRDSCRRFGVA